MRIGQKAESSRLGKMTIPTCRVLSPESKLRPPAAFLDKKRRDENAEKDNGILDEREGSTQMGLDTQPTNKLGKLTSPDLQLRDSVALWGPLKITIEWRAMFLLGWTSQMLQIPLFSSTRLPTESQLIPSGTAGHRQQDQRSGRR